MPHTAKLTAQLNALNKEIAMLLDTAALVSASTKKSAALIVRRRVSKRSRWAEPALPSPMENRN